MIDYAWTTTAGTLPRMMNGNRRTARLVRNAATAVGVNSMITNYEGGVVRIIPMKAHLAIDFLMCAALMASPFFLPRSERRYSAVPVLLGFVGLASSLLTQTKSPGERAVKFTPSYELSEAVADPDVARSPHLRAHLE